MKKLEDIIQKLITWLENNQEAEKYEYDHKQKSLEEIANSIMMKLHNGVDTLDKVIVEMKELSFEVTHFES
jgi:hypothetical protein